MHSLASLRADALEIARAAIAAADPYRAVRQAIRWQNGQLEIGTEPVPLAPHARLFVVGAGKASARMAQAVEASLGDRITSGLINTKDAHLAPLRYIELNECSHPVPDSRGVAGAQRIANLVQSATADDLVLCLISGGASALLPLPAPGLTLSDKQVATSQLLASGATIHEVNAVRKHLSALKGGRLAQLAAPARLIALLLSDVVGDQLDVIGSGPTAPDPSTFAEARDVLHRYGLWALIPAAVRDHLQNPSLPETPQPGDPLFHRVRNIIIGSNRLALAAAEQVAVAKGYAVHSLGDSVQGEARDVALDHLRRLASLSASPACLLSGGECTVTIRGPGSGGRNQEFVLALVDPLTNVPGVVALSVGTDGTDGPTDAAGAIADSQTAGHASTLGLAAADFLARNDSYHFFDPLGELIKTGPTGTNVMDVRILLRGPAH